LVVLPLSHTQKQQAPGRTLSGEGQPATVHKAMRPGWFDNIQEMSVPGATTVVLEGPRNGCQDQSCEGRTFNVNMARPPCASHWPAARWSSFTSEMASLVKTYQRDGYAALILLFIPLAMIMMMSSVHTMEGPGIGLTFPMVFFTIFAFFGLTSVLKAGNEKVDEQIRQLCHANSDARCTIRLVTAWTGTCKPKHARTYRALQFFANEGQVVGGQVVGGQVVVSTLPMQPVQGVAVASVHAAHPLNAGMPVQRMPVQPVRGVAVASAVPEAPVTQTMQIQCPAGSSAGDTLQINTASGPMQLTVPPGIGEGMSFQVQVPAAAPVSIVAATVIANDV